VHRLASIGERQFGMVARHQAVSAGVAATTFDRWIATGDLVAEQPRVARIAGAPRTWDGRLLAATMAAGAGAGASHRAAGVLWGGLEEAPVEIVVPYGRLPRLRDGVIVHRTRDPLVLHRRRGIPVTTPMRMVVDLGAVAPAHEVEAVLDRLEVARTVTVAAVEWELAAVARPGRRGAGTLRRVLDRRALLETPPDGVLEPRFARLLKQAGLPMAVFQFRVSRFEIDFAYPDLLLAIEVDGYGPHSSRRAFQADRDRQNTLVGLGWTVLRFTWTDVVKRPDHVARTIAEAIVNAQARMWA
jgi:very-short-patch-repair endonuclease